MVVLCPVKYLFLSRPVLVGLLEQKRNRPMQYPTNHKRDYTGGCNTRWFLTPLFDIKPCLKGTTVLKLYIHYQIKYFIN